MQMRSENGVTFTSDLCGMTVRFLGAGGRKVGGSQMGSHKVSLTLSEELNVCCEASSRATRGRRPCNGYMFTYLPVCIIVPYSIIAQDMLVGTVL